MKTIALLGLIIGQPYIMTVEHPTHALIAMCRQDPDCMDVEKLEVPVVDCTTDAECCAKYPEIDPEFCKGI